jgi:dTDP-4-dehydrorhamnose 3,5-epimerase
MVITPLAIPDVKLIRPVRHGDARGWFRETWKHAALNEAGITTVFTQDNEAFSSAPGTLRGLHFQRAPHAQAKLVRAVSGRILDVVVDLRRGSAHYGHHVAQELTAEGGEQLFVPEGFAHGYVTLTADTLVAYKVSGSYRPDAEGGLRWDDPALGIAWPGIVDPGLIKPADRNWPLLAGQEPL